MNLNLCLTLLYLCGDGSLGAVAGAAIKGGTETQFDTSNMGVSTVDHDDGVGKITRMLRVRDFDTVDSVISELEEIMQQDWRPDWMILLTNSPNIVTKTSPEFSEEKGGYSMPMPGPIHEIQCFGGHCDNKKLVSIANSSGKNILRLNNNYWTTWFSEEDSHREDCQDDFVVTQIQCNGGNCDNMRLQCNSLNSDYFVENDVTMKTSFYSEEQVTGKCRNGYYVTGMECNGSRCDDIALHCTRIKYQ